jgi:xylan 1,4-beta-xylosidase
MPQPANPILRGMHPDPSVCRVDGTYYLATSTFEYLPGIPIYTSTDLVEWRLAGHAIHDAGAFDFAETGDSRGIFAPTIRHHEGLFYVACTQVDGGAGSGNFYVTATDVAGPWSEPVWLPDARGIDPSLFFHEGRAWWTGCREVLEPTFEGETEVWLQELDLAGRKLIGPQTVIWERTQYRAVWAEAPHLYHHDGWFYLLTAEGGTAFEHSVMIARSRDLGGPYLPCPRNPILTHRHLGHGVAVQAVGHADLFEGDPGQWWMAMLAMRPIDGHTILGRETHLARVEWEEGWPVVNPGLGVLDPPVARAGIWGSDGVPAVADFLTVRGFASFAEPQQDRLIMLSTGEPIGSKRQPAALLRRLTSTECTVSVELDAIDQDAVAGLVLRQSGDAHVRLELSRAGDGACIRLIAPGDTRDDAVALPHGPVILSARVTAAGVDWTAGTPGEPMHSLGETPLNSLSTETAGGFVGTTFGPYVSGPKGASVAFTSWSQEDRL